MLGLTIDSSLTISGSAGGGDNIVFSYSAEKGIIPEVGTNTTYTSPARMVLNSDNYYQPILANGAAITGGRHVYNWLTGNCSSEDINDGNWGISAGTIDSATQFTAGSNNDFIVCPLLGAVLAAGEIIAFRCEISTDDPSAKIRFQLVEVGGSTTNSTYRVPISGLPYGDTITAIGDGTDFRFRISCDTNGTTVTVTNIAIYRTSFFGDISGYIPEYVSAGVLSAPYNRAGIDGLKVFNTALNNSVFSGAITDAIGSTITPSGILVEAQASNALGANLHRDWSSWTNDHNGGVTLDASRFAGIDGTKSAAKISRVNANNDGFNLNAITLSTSTDYTVKFFIKGGDAAQSTVIIYDDNATANLAAIIVNWSAGVPSDSGGGSGYTGLLIKSRANDWYEVCATVTTAGTVTTHKLIVIPESNGSGTEFIYFDWAQIVDLDVDSSPIEGNTTRTAILEEKVNPISTANGFWGLIEYTPEDSTNNSGDTLLSFFKDANNALRIQMDAAAINFRKRIAGANTDAQASYSETIETTAKLAFCVYADNTTAFCIDGGTVATDSNTDALDFSSSVLNIGLNTTGTFVCNASIARLVLGIGTKTSPQLQALTT